MKKLIEHTYGYHAYMKVMIEIDGNPEIHEIDTYWDGSNKLYKTTADNDPVRRAEIIKAFEILY